MARSGSLDRPPHTCLRFPTTNPQGLDPSCTSTTVPEPLFLPLGHVAPHRTLVRVSPAGAHVLDPHLPDAGGMLLSLCHREPRCLLRVSCSGLEHGLQSRVPCRADRAQPTTSFTTSKPG